MKIGITCPYSWDVPGGVQQHIRDLAEALIDEGHEVSVPSFVWVDAKGRLVQVTGSLRVGGHLPAAVRGTFRSLGLTRPVTTTDTLRLSGFGVPVHIEAPTVLRTPDASGGSFVVNVTCKS